MKKVLKGNHKKVERKWWKFLFKGNEVLDEGHNMRQWFLNLFSFSPLSTPFINLWSLFIVKAFPFTSSSFSFPWSSIWENFQHRKLLFIVFIVLLSFSDFIAFIIASQLFTLFCVYFILLLLMFWCFQLIYAQFSIEIYWIYWKGLEIWTAKNFFTHLNPCTKNLFVIVSFFKD